jgi:hypothetical protein
MSTSDNWNYGDYGDESHFVNNDHITADTPDITGVIEIVHNVSYNFSGKTLWLGSPVNPATSQDGNLLMGHHPNSPHEFMCYDGASVIGVGIYEQRNIMTYRFKHNGTHIYGYLNDQNVCNDTSPGTGWHPGIKVFTDANYDIYIDSIKLYKEGVIAPTLAFGSEIENITAIPNLTIAYVSPTPDDNVTIGFDYNVVINVSFSNGSPILKIELTEGSDPPVNYTQTDLGNYVEFRPNITSGKVYSYVGIITEGSSEERTEVRTMKVSALTQEQLDEGLGGADIQYDLLLLFIILGTLILAIFLMK